MGSVSGGSTIGRGLRASLLLSWLDWFAGVDFPELELVSIKLVSVEFIELVLLSAVLD